MISSSLIEAMPTVSGEAFAVLSNFDIVASR